ncbi:MAG TPA: fibronectin type III domain-containing protein [Jatrophihabitans sp.]|nr:fibronectin type III domain-containing protein [Jatrophihabitans sp.]
MFVPANGRLLDTRNGTGGFSTPMPANSVRTVPAVGVAGIPASGVSAVALTLTVVGAATVGAISVAPGDVATPTGTALVFNPGDSVSNTDLVALHGDGSLHVLSNASANLVIDVQGYFTAGTAIAPGGFVPVDQTRIVDTRTGLNVPQSRVSTGNTITVTAAGLAGVPADAEEIYANIAILNQTSNGYLRTYAADQSPPTTGALGFDNTTQSESVALPLSSAGAFTIMVGAGGPVDLTVDIQGYFTPGTSSGAFTPAAVHLLDTRAAPTQTLAGGAVLTVSVSGVDGIPGAQDGLTAVALNIRTVQASSNTTYGGYLRLWPADEDEPNISSVNYTSQNIYRTNLTFVAPAADGTIDIRNGGSGAVDVVIDVEGWYSSGPLPPQISSSAVHDMDWISPIASVPFHVSSTSLAAPVTSYTYTYTYDNQPPVMVSGASADISVPATAIGHHQLSVSAIDALGLQSPMQGFDFSVGGVTTPAQNVTVQPAHASALISWSQPSNLNGADLSEVAFNVDVISAVSGDYVLGGGCVGSCTSLVITGLSPSTTYHTVVTAHTDAGDSDISQSADFQVTDSGDTASCINLPTCAIWTPGSTQACADASRGLTADWVCDGYIRTVSTTDNSGATYVQEDDTSDGVGVDITNLTDDQADAAFQAAEAQAVSPAQTPQPSSYQAAYNNDSYTPSSPMKAARYQSKRSEEIVWHINRHTGHTNFYHGLNIKWHSADVTMRYGSSGGEAVSLNWKERLRHDKSFESDTTLREFGDFGSSIPSSQARTYHIDAWSNGYDILPYRQYTVFFDAYALYLRWSGTGIRIAGSVQSDRIKCYKTTSCKF